MKNNKTNFYKYFIISCTAIIILLIFCQKNEPEISIPNSTSNSSSYTTTSTSLTLNSTLTANTSTSNFITSGENCSDPINLNVLGVRTGDTIKYNGPVNAKIVDFTNSCAGSGVDCVFIYTVPTSSEVTLIDIDTCDMTGSDTVIWIGKSCGEIYHEMCNDDGCNQPYGPSKLLNVPVLPQEKIYIVVKMYGDSELTSAKLTLKEYSFHGNTCNDAIDLNSQGIRNNIGISFSNNVGGITSDYLGCVGTGVDVVFKYSVPTGSNIVSIDVNTCNMSESDTVIWIGSTCGQDNLGECDDDGCTGGSPQYVPSLLSEVPVIEGNTYYIVVKLYGEGQLLSAELELIENKRNGIGDTCSDIINLNTIGNRNLNQIEFDNSVGGSSANFTGCSGSGGDIVFSYTVPSGSNISSVDLSAFCGIMSDVTIWIGSTCGANDLGSCSSKDCNSLAALSNFPVISGTTYYIVVKKNLSGSLYHVRLLLTENIPKPLARWTFMMYFDGDNNLEGLAIEDINEMESVSNIPSDANIIVLLDRVSGYDTSNGNWTDTRAFYITHDNDILINNSPRISIGSLGISNTGNSVENNMACEKTLSSFLAFCKTNYPATNYGLVLWNHGGGWRNKPHPSIVKSVCTDDTNGGILNNSQVRNAITLSMGSGATKSLNVIGFDACGMGEVETAFEMRDIADYATLSMKNVPGTGYYYGGTSYNTGWFNRFFSRSVGAQTPANCSIDIVNSYRDYYEMQGGEETHVAINLSYMNLLASQTELWAQTQSRTSLDTANNFATNYSGGTIFNFYEVTLHATNPSSTLAQDIRNTITNMTIANYNLSSTNMIPGIAIVCDQSYGNADYLCSNIQWACSGGSPTYASIISTWY